MSNAGPRVLATPPRLRRGLPGGLLAKEIPNAEITTVIQRAGELS